MSAYPKCFILFLYFISVAGIFPAFAANDRFSQLVFTFPNERKYTYHYEPITNALVLELRDTTSDDLESIGRYDERVIRRVLLKDVGSAGMEVRLILKDDNVRAMVSDFKEPFRVVVDLYDKTYKEGRDPVSGLPLDFASSSTEVRVSSPRGYSSENEKPDLRNEQIPEQSQNNRPHRLLQPTPMRITKQDQMIEELNRVGEGAGKSWKNYPIYIYRLQTGAYKINKNYQTYINNNTQKALTSYEQMAKYAGDLYDFGHENRALVAYQQVIHHEPSVFDKDAMHLWKLAEIHLGQGNLILADGYYEALTTKHPDSHLSGFAALRRLDVKAIKGINEGNVKAFGPLATALEKIDYRENQELRAQIAIRRAYWSPANDAEISKIIADKYYLPSLNGNSKLYLNESHKNVENALTAFIVASLLLNEMVSEKAVWKSETGSAAADYFDRYRGEKLKPIMDSIAEKTTNLFNKSIQENLDKKEYLEAIQTYESLSKTLRLIGEDRRTMWALGESYRLTGNITKAVPFYESAARLYKEGLDRFRSEFWLSISLGEVIEVLKAKTNNEEEIQVKQRKLEEVDRNVWSTWTSLRPSEQNVVLTAMKEPIEKAVTANYFLKSPPKIALEGWKKSLSPDLVSKEGDISKVAETYHPSANALYFLNNLSNRFAKLGLGSELLQSKNLYAKLKPSSFSGDKKAITLWAKNVTALAEEYRINNQYLEAGRLFALTGRETPDWEGRAEALYKGGLLLYRAGRRDEALQAFKEASEDGNNLLYADLAKKRLALLQK
ncbi:MAG: tetratricopeptide repeat protein [Oligoflexales bacterium]|nr:tetratricopeptide repeat protein [Oligoflexales bacterium]